MVAMVVLYRTRNYVFCLLINLIGSDLTGGIKPQNRLSPRFINKATTTKQQV
jgi:hypothetical protein